MASLSAISLLQSIMSKESLIAETEKDMFKALKEMKSALIHQIIMEFDVHDVIKTVAEGMEKYKIPDTEVVPILWDALMDTLDYSDGRVGPEVLECFVSDKVALWSQLLRAFCVSVACELKLLDHIVRRSIKEQRLQVLFEDVVHDLYEFDVLSDVTILYWFNWHINADIREKPFVKDLKPLADALERETGLTEAWWENVE